MYQRLITNPKYFWLDSSFTLIIASLVGLCTGFAAVGLQHLITLFHNLFFGGGAHLLGKVMGSYYVLLIPAAGGMVVGPLVYFLAREAKGHGVPEVMAAVAERDGVMSPRTVLVKGLAASVSIGSGGSVGWQGPIVHISSAIGSSIGQGLRLPPSLLKTLVACGAAGGISATFNAPIGGVLFAQELILGEFATSNFILIVIASITANIVSRAYLGDFPAFRVPAYELKSAEEMVFYLVLGLLCGLFSVLYIKVFYRTGDWFDRIRRVPDYFKPVLGGFVVGAIGLCYPQVFGVGYETVEQILLHPASLHLMVALLFMKLLATSVTLGSGGSGGVFAPSLFMGAMLGGAWGIVVNNGFAGVAAPAGAYALVGMGGVFAGTSQAPITAIILLFEMTGDYKVVLPLMLVCVISSLAARGIYPQTLYTEKLARRGLDLRRYKRPDILSDIAVEQIMTRQVATLEGDLPVHQARQVMMNHSYTGFPVLRQGRLAGMVTYEDIYRAVQTGAEDLALSHIASRKIVSVHPQDSVRQALEKMVRADIGRLPVVSAADPGILVGIVSRSDIIRAHSLMEKD